MLERNFILFNAVHDYHDYRIEAERGLPLLLFFINRFLYSAILRSRADSLRSHVILHE